MVVVVEQHLTRAALRLSNEDGQGLIEYTLIVALISMAAIGAILLLGPKITTVFTNVGTALT